jgi:hypothetical protein
MAIWLAACCFSSSLLAAESNEKTHRCVVSFKDEQSLQRFRAMPPGNLKIAKVIPGFPRVKTIVELDIKTTLELCDVLATIRKVAGVEAALPVGKNRHSLVVEFDSPLTSGEAAKRFAEVRVQPLKISVSGNRDRSAYYEVIVDTDDSLKDLLARMRQASGIVVAELNVTYRQNEVR